MYLATVEGSTEPVYEIRQSYAKEDGSYGHRLIFSLGRNPRAAMTFAGEQTILFADNLLLAVSAHADRDVDLILEDLLWDFLPHEVKRRASPFRHRRPLAGGPLSDLEGQAIASQIHLFDRRRLYFIRYGGVDQSRLSRLHEKCCRPLLGQSRDEREFWFRAEERCLPVEEYHRYVYAIFNLQRHFQQSFAPWFPEALAEEEVADWLLTDICQLNGDSSFWKSEAPTWLHPHLRRYLIMFFDHKPATPSFQRDFARAFMSSHRRFRWPQKATQQSAETIGKAFGLSYQRLKTMSQQELTRLFRQRAKELHPDRGGDHELFIQLSQAYEALRKKQ